MGKQAVRKKGLAASRGEFHGHLSQTRFCPVQRQVNVKLSPNFTSKKGGFEVENQAFFARIMLIIRRKHNGTD